MHFSIPLDPVNSTLKNAWKHYEEAKKTRKSIGLERYRPCINECKKDQTGEFKCTISDGGWKYTEKCQRFEDSDSIKIEKADLDILQELWDLLIDLITGNLANLTKRSVAAALAVGYLLGTGISSLISYFNSDQIKQLNEKQFFTTENDIIMSKSLRTIYSFQNQTANNIEKVSNAIHEVVLADSILERRIQINEIDAHRNAHIENNYKLMYLGIKTVKNILEQALHGKLSTEIALLIDVKSSYNKFERKAENNGYIVPANAFAHLFQMPTSYFFNKEDQTINLIVHIPLIRTEKAWTMQKYIGTTIPVSDHHGIVLKNDKDIIAYDDEKYITLKSEDLWKCPKIGTVHFCRDIISSVKPRSRMQDTCLGSIIEGNFHQLLEKCQDVRIKNLENEAKRISKNAWVLYSKEKSKIEITCMTKPTKEVPYAKKETRKIEINGFKKISMSQNCMGKFNDEDLWAETTLDSDNNVANYWLPRENDFLKSYPGIDEPKVMKVLEKLPKNIKSQPFSEILKNADEIDFNVKMKKKIDSQGIHNQALYGLGSSVWLIALILLIVYCVKTKKPNTNGTNGRSEII